MSWSEDNNDRAWKQGLQSRFDHYEPDVNDSLEEKILGPSQSRRPQWKRYAAVLVVLGLVALFFKPLTHRMHVSSPPRHSAVTHPHEAKQGAYVRGIGGLREQLLPVPEKASTRAELLKPARKGKASHAGIRTVARQAAAHSVMDVEKPLLNTESGSIMSAGKDTDPELLVPHGLFFSESSRGPVVSMPEVTIGKGEDEPGKQDLHWRFSATPLQTFQILTLRSTPESGYQDIRFAPVGSMRSKGLKITAGVEKAGLGLVMSYAYLRNWTRYELATNQYDVQSSPATGFQVTRRGVEQEQDDKLHLLGVGIRKSFGPYRILDGIQDAMIGADFTRILSMHRNMVSVSAKVGRRFKVADKLQFSVGPYIEIGLTQRAILPGVWKYRPYQAGISLEFIK